LTERAKSQSIAANYKPNPQHLITPLSNLLGGEQAKENKTTTDALNTYGNVKPGESITVTTTTTTTTVVSKNGNNNNNNNNNNERQSYPSHRTTAPQHFSAGPPPLTLFGGGGPTIATGIPTLMEPWAGIPPSPPRSPPPGSPRYMPMDNYGSIQPPPLDLGRPISPPLPINDVLEDDNSIVVGLRVYTQKSAPTLISGKLKSL